MKERIHYGTDGLGGGGGTTDHSLLTNRSLASQHPATAIDYDNTLYPTLPTDVQLVLDALANKSIHDKGWFTTPTALRTAYPTATDGDWAIVGTTDTIWDWDSDTSDWKDSGVAAASNVPVQTNYLIVDPLVTPILGKSYHSVNDCLTYIATQTPSTTNRFIIEVGGLNTENITVPEYVGIVGDGSTILSGQITSSCGLGSFEFRKAFIQGCIINNLIATGMVMLSFYGCKIMGGTTDALLYFMFNSEVRGGDFSGNYLSYIYDSTLGGDTHPIFSAGVTLHKCDLIAPSSAYSTFNGGDFWDCYIGMDATTGNTFAAGTYFFKACQFDNWLSPCILDVGNGTDVVTMELDQCTFRNTIITVNSGSTLYTRGVSETAVTLAGSPLGTWVNKGDLYDNTSTGYVGTNFQDVIDEIILKKITGILYVAKNGNDTLGDGSALSPFLTIQHAIDSVILPSDTNRTLIHIAPGKYNEQITLKQFIHLYGEPDSVEIIYNTGDVIIAPTSMAHFEADLYNIIIENTGTGAGIHVQNNATVLLNNVYASVMDEGLIIDGDGFVSASGGSSFASTNKSGAKLNDTSFAYFSDTIFYGNAPTYYDLETAVGSMVKFGTDCDFQNNALNLLGTTEYISKASTIGNDSIVPGNNVKEALDNLFNSLSIPTQNLWVDGNRVDVYIETGSISQPFKTIASATAVATSGSQINVVYKSGGYVENVTLPDGVSMTGEGDLVTIEGNFTTTVSSPINIRNISFTGTAKTLTINCPISFIDCYSVIAVVLNNAITQGYNFHLIAPSGVTALTVNGAGSLFQNIMCTISSSGNVPTINAVTGSVLLMLSKVQGGRAAGDVITSASGSVQLFNTSIVNSLGGAAITMNNGSIATAPNILHGVIAAGNVVCGTAYTHVDNISFLAGAISGTNLIYPTSSRMKNDSLVVGSTITDALNTLNSSTGGGFVEANTLIVDPTATVIVGKCYNTVAAALAYAATMTPSATNRFAIYVSGTNTEAITVPSWVAIIGNLQTRLTGAIDSAGMLSSDFNEFYVYGCHITNMSVSASVAINFSKCYIEGGSSNASAFVIVFDGFINGGTFNGGIVGSKNIFFGGTFNGQIESDTSWFAAGTYNGIIMSWFSSLDLSALTLTSVSAYQFTSCVIKDSFSIPAGVTLNLTNCSTKYNAAITITVPTGRTLTMKGCPNIIPSNTGGTITVTGDYYDNTLSSLTSTDEKGAIDELASVRMIVAENIDIDIGTETVDTFADTLGKGAVWHYTVDDGTNFRAGTIQAIWNSTADTYDFNETATNDIGDTSGVSFSVDINTNNVRLLCTVTTDNWNCKVKRILI